MHEKCHWCGGERSWSHQMLTPNRSSQCYRRQIERLQNELVEAVAMRHGTDGKLARMQPVVDSVVAMLAIDKEHRFQALDEVIEAGKKYIEKDHWFQALDEVIEAGKKYKEAK